MQQIFNYHTHTKRCNHASIFEVKEYAYLAHQNGIKTLGFSDHVPLTELEYPEVDTRMHISEVDDYIKEVDELKKQYTDMTFLIGFEAEYDETRALFLKELRDKVDYLILGEHNLRNITNINNPNYPIEYAKECINALDSGLFDIFAHPDYFMIERRHITSKQGLELFDRNSIIASKMICEKAKELSIPLEINLNGFVSNKLYPNKVFWKVCEEISPLVVIGSDAHNPNRFNEMSKEMENVLNYLGDLNLNFVKDDYNPIINRNPLLNMRLSSIVKNSHTYETMRAREIMLDVLTKLPDDLDRDTISYQIESILNNNMNNLSIIATEKDKDLLNRMERVALKQDLSFEEKSYKLGRYKTSISNFNHTLLNQQRACTRLIETVKSAFNIGAISKDELLDLVIKLTEIKTTKDLSVRNVLIREINEKYNGREIEGGKENASKLVKKNPMFQTEENNFFSWNTKGYTTIAFLTLIITFAFGIFTGIILVMLG